MTRRTSPSDPIDPAITGDTTTQPDVPPYDPHAIFREDGPLNPSFMHEAVRSLLRTMPLDAAEPTGWGHRRMYCAMLALAALHPRDEIEVLLGVQALAAWQAAAACWRIGMNHHQPNGDSTRHVTTAANAARTFDSLLKALERRQAKPLTVPIGRPPARLWNTEDPTRFLLEWEARCRRGELTTPPEPPDEPQADGSWTPARLAVATRLIIRARSDEQYQDLDIANTEGILPGGGMIVPDNPSPRQEAYMARRLGLSYHQQWGSNLRRGDPALPRIRPIRPGDLIP